MKIFQEGKYREKRTSNNSRQGVYLALGAIFCVILAFLLMWFSTKFELVTPDGSLSVYLSIIVHDPAERELNLIYEIVDGDNKVVIENEAIIELAEDDREFLREDEIDLEERIAYGEYTFKGSVLDDNQKTMITEFDFRVISPWLIWFFGSFLFMWLFILAILLLLLAYLNRRDTKDNIHKLIVK